MKKCHIIYADPPWEFGSKVKHSKNGGMQFELKNVYPTMGIDDICNLGVKLITKKNAVLFIWTTDAHLECCLKVINAWGFNYKTVGFIWNKKEKLGTQVCYMGAWTMKGSEICLFATKGNPSHLLKSRKVRQLVEAARGAHSEKPNEVRKRIVEMFGDIPRVELFARDKKEGFDVWGNDVECDIEL